MDRAVQKTDDDAAMSKYSAIQAGYFQDDFIKYFCARQPPRRLPLINIGTYCRVRGINRLIDEFLERTASAPRRAIVSLGAGSDTRAFHLLPEYDTLDYFELDFPVKSQKKEQIVSANEQLRAIVEQANGRYHSIGIDLRDLGREPDLTNELLQPLLELRDRPTLILSECCLCYLQPKDSDGVLKFFANCVPHPLLSVAIYEPLSLNDEFGRVMAENLAMRGLSLPTIHQYPNLESQKQRLTSLLHVDTVGVVNIETVYSEWLDRADLQRISRLEFLDEVEEMHLLMRHYCIAWGFSNAQI